MKERVGSTLSAPEAVPYVKVKAPLVKRSKRGPDAIRGDDILATWKAPAPLPRPCDEEMRKNHGGQGGNILQVNSE